MHSTKTQSVHQCVSSWLVVIDFSVWVLINAADAGTAGARQVCLAPVLY